MLDGSDIAAYSLATGAPGGRQALPVSFSNSWIDRGRLVAGDLLIAQTADGGLAAVRLGFQPP